MLAYLPYRDRVGSEAKIKAGRQARPRLNATLGIKKMDKYTVTADYVRLIVEVINDCITLIISDNEEDEDGVPCGECLYVQRADKDRWKLFQVNKDDNWGFDYITKIHHSPGEIIFGVIPHMQNIGDQTEIRVSYPATDENLKMVSEGIDRIFMR